MSINNYILNLLNIEYIENSFKYDINNGIIEGTNNLIKTLKRCWQSRRLSHEN